MVDTAPIRCQLCEGRGVVWSASKCCSFRKHLTGNHDSDLKAIQGRQCREKIVRLDGKRLRVHVEALKRMQVMISPPLRPKSQQFVGLPQRRDLFQSRRVVVVDQINKRLPLTILQLNQTTLNVRGPIFAC
jgi:hypothetical protein